MAASGVLYSVLLVLIARALPASKALSNETIQEVTDSLFNNGYNAMALTLQFGHIGIFSPYFTFTIFAPQDSAFKRSGQPSLSLLSYHISPLYIPFSTFNNFPYGSRIPTVSSNSSLFVTSSTSGSVNGVNINPAIYDDGFVAVYGIEKFFDQEFQAPDDDNEKPNRNFVCSGDKLWHWDHPFAKACEVLRSRGYSSIASILEMQFGSFQNQSTRRDLTIFAPSDRAFFKFKNRRNLRPVFFRHVLPCRLPMRALRHLDGMQLSTYLDGFSIKTTRTKDGRKINGVSFADPDLYSNNWLIVHGIKDVIHSNEESRKRSSGGTTEANSKLFSAIFFLAMFL